jgi:alkyl hydroperoxide reductase subunit AhpC
MSEHDLNLPKVGMYAPYFEAQTEKGLIQFPEYSQGCWCIIFAHPANFTSAWTMFSAFLALKERWLTERNTRIIAISNESIRQNNFSDKARRYLGIYLKAPVIEDLDFTIANVYGMASTRRPRPGCDRLAYVIDPEGRIRMIITRPLLPNIESALEEIEKKLDRLQRNLEDKEEVQLALNVESHEQSDALEEVYKTKPAHFSRKKIHPN